MKLWTHYIPAHTIEEALNALHEAEGAARAVAGGTDLLLEIAQGRTPPAETLVDVTGIPALNVLAEQDGMLFIGAGVPVADVQTHALVTRHAAALATACGLIGGPQVRNAATLGGNVAHALPAADGMIALLALDAQAVIASAEGMRTVPLISLFAGPGKSTLQPKTEILIGFRLALREAGEGSAFGRVMRPQGVALPILNLGVWVKRTDDLISDLRLAVGPAGPVPQRARAVEDCLRGQPWNAESLECARRTWQETIRFRSSPMRATWAYRQHLSPGLMEDVLGEAWRNAALPLENAA